MTRRADTSAVNSPSVQAAAFGLGKTPVAAQAHLVDATDLATALTRINAILDALEAFGFVAAS